MGGVMHGIGVSPGFVVLVGLGITSLSLAPRAIPAVRAALAERTLNDCRQVAAAALSAPDPAAARRLAD